jgi:hypothetical protein
MPSTGRSVRPSSGRTPQLWGRPISSSTIESPYGAVQGTVSTPCQSGRSSIGFVVHRAQRLPVGVVVFARNLILPLGPRLRVSAASSGDAGAGLRGRVG